MQPALTIRLEDHIGLICNAIKPFVRMRHGREPLPDTEEFSIGCLVLLQAIQRGSYDAKRDFRCWAAAVVRNAVRDAYRTERRQKRLAERATLRLSESGEPSSEHQGFRQVDERDITRAMIHSLPVVQRRLLRRYFWDGRSISEAACCRVRSTASWRLAQILKRLRKQFAEST